MGFGLSKVIGNLSKTMRKMGGIVYSAIASYSAASIFSLPSTGVSNGQLNVSLQGNSLKNELNYTPSTWAEWTKSGAAGDATGLEFTSNAAFVSAYLLAAFKISTKYGIIYNIVSCSLTTDTFYVGGGSGLALPSTVSVKTVGNQKIIVTSNSSITTNSMAISVSGGVLGNKVKIRDIRIFELPTGSQIETDFTNLTADQLAAKYPYLQGGGVKSTFRDGGRVKSVGKNLLHYNYAKLLSPLIMYSGGTKATLTSDNKLYVNDTNDTSNLGVRWINIPVVGGQAYTIQCQQTVVNSRVFNYFAAEFFKADGSACNSIPSGWQALSGPGKGFYDLYGNNVWKTNGTQSCGFTVPTDCAKINIELTSKYNEISEGYAWNFQLELGNSATAYEPYAESTAYIPPSANGLISVGAVKDEISVGDGMKVQRNDKYIIQPGDIILYTGYANVELARVLKTLLIGGKGIGDDIAGWVTSESKTEYTSALGHDDAANVGKYTTRISANYVDFYLAKGTSLNDAKTALTGLTLIYRLAAPQYTSQLIRTFDNGNASPSLKCYGNNTTVMLEPCVSYEGKPDAAGLMYMDRYRNELMYTPGTWAEWTKPTGAVGDATGLEITLNGSGFIQPSIPVNIKTSTKYLILANVVSNTLGVQLQLLNSTFNFENLVSAGTTGNIKLVATSKSAISTSIFSLTNSSSGVSGNKIKIKDIRVYECPSGSQISADADTLTADQLAAKYPWPTSTLTADWLTCYRNDGTAASPLWTPATASLDTGNRKVTITGADSSKDYFIAASIDQSGSTLATVNESHPLAPVVPVMQKLSALASTTASVVTVPADAISGELNVSLQGNTDTNIISNGNFVNTTGWTGAGTSVSAVSNKLRVLTDGSTGSHFAKYDVPIPPITGHKYYIVLRISDIVTGQAGFAFYNRKSDGAYENVSSGAKNANGTYSLILPVTNIYATPEFYIRANIYNAAGTSSYTGTTEEAKFSYVMAIDLTAKFGAGNEPVIAQCDLRYLNWFDGTKSTFKDGGRVKTVGANKFNEIWELGTISGADGSLSSASDIVRSKGYITLDKTKTYNFSSSIPIYLYKYDDQKNFIGVVSTSFTGATYARLRCQATSGVSQFPVNTVVSETGVYQAYTESIAAIPASTNGLTSVGSVKDEISIADGTRTQRNGQIVLNGSENWVIFATQTNTITFEIISPTFLSMAADIVNTDGTNSKYFADKFSWASYTTDIECLALHNHLGVNWVVINILKSKLSTQDIAGFKTWLSANQVTLTYKLASPMVTPANITYTENGQSSTGLKCWGASTTIIQEADDPTATTLATISGGYPIAVYDIPRNEVVYTPSTWAEWTKDSGVVGDGTGLEFTSNGATLYATCNTQLKPNTKYGILLNCLANTASTSNPFRLSSYYTGSAIVIINELFTGNIKTVLTTQASIGTNAFRMYLDNSVSSGQKIKIRDVRIFELPTGSQIEFDFTNLTANQLAVKYPY